LLYIRGFIPWTNFPQSATVYSWNDWKFIIDQAARMRMNFIHIHNYNGQNGHNEMFHNFTVNGYTSRTWMPTARSGHQWACPGFEVKNFRFGGGDLFDDYDFGSSGTLHNESLSNEEVSSKGISLFQKVIAYAHQRGVKIALGIDIDLILPEYGLPADDPLVIHARIKQITTDYPDLDYLVLFISEMIHHDNEKLEQWQRIFDAMYIQVKETAHNTRIAVSGWGLKKEIADQLPRDVIAAPISGYSDSFEDGSIYGDREYWGCPWLERDIYSSNYYYPYEMHLSNTISAFSRKAANIKGLYCLSWRITDAVDAKLSYIAKAPWDSTNKYKTSYDVYAEYAEKNYGQSNVHDIVHIINQNEPVCSKVAECQPTGQFTGKDFHETDYLLNIKKIELSRFGKTYKSIHAYNFDSASEVKRWITAGNDSCVAEINYGDYLLFRDVDFGLGMTEIKAAISTQNSAACVGFRLDSLNGKSLGMIDVIHSGGWTNWSTQQTAAYEVKGIHDLYVLFNTRREFENQYDKSIAQLEIISNCIRNESDKGNQYRLGLLYNRIASVRDYLEIDKTFPHIKSSAQLPGSFPSWVQNFTHRVTDISSLGNTQSIQNRYVQERYLEREKELLDSSEIKFPTRVTASGTKNGAGLSWTNNEPELSGTEVYRNGEKIAEVNKDKNQFKDIFHGEAIYQLKAIRTGGQSGDFSASVKCYAGNADKEAPKIIVVSPPKAIVQEQKNSISARILDNRDYPMISATLYYRKAGDKNWKSKQMSRRTKSIFYADFPEKINGNLLEYYIKAGDGDNTAFYPATAPLLSSTVVYEDRPSDNTLETPSLVVKDNVLHWEPIHRAFIYHIYRLDDKSKRMDGSTYLAYLPKDCDQFSDLTEDFGGNTKKGSYWYVIVTEDFDGNRSKPSNILRIDYP